MSEEPWACQSARDRPRGRLDGDNPPAGRTGVLVLQVSDDRQVTPQVLEDFGDVLAEFTQRATAIGPLGPAYADQRLARKVLR